MRRTTLSTPSTYEEHLVNILVSYTRGSEIKYRNKVTKGMFLRLPDSSPQIRWDFIKYEYIVVNKSITASPDPTSPTSTISMKENLLKAA